MGDINPMQKFQNLFIVLIITTVTLSRLAEAYHFGFGYNFASFSVLALFLGTVIEKRWISILAIISCVWLSDLIIDHNFFGHFVWFYPGFYWQYLSYVIFCFFGRFFLKQLKFIPIITLALSSSILFFLISNFGVWCSTDLYSHHLEGLIICYLAAIPFFRHAMMTDLFFSILLFGAWRFCFQTGFFRNSFGMIFSKKSIHSGNNK